MFSAFELAIYLRRDSTMEFIGRKISRDGTLEATFIVDIVEAQICPNKEVPEICCCIKARNTMAEYRLETPDGQKLSTAEAEGFLAALKENNPVKLDDFGLVISNIEYGERTVRRAFWS